MKKIIQMDWCQYKNCGERFRHRNLRRFFIEHVKAIENWICIHPKQKKIILNSEWLFKYANFHTFLLDLMVHLIFSRYESNAETHLPCNCFDLKNFSIKKPTCQLYLSVRWHKQTMYLKHIKVAGIQIMENVDKIVLRSSLKSNCSTNRFWIFPNSRYSHDSRLLLLELHHSFDNAFDTLVMTVNAPLTLNNMM